MKIVKIFLYVAAIFVIASCAPMAQKTDNVSITLPKMPSFNDATGNTASVNTAARSAGDMTSAGTENCTFIITVTDSTGTKQTKTGHSGETVTFTVATGNVEITSAAYETSVEPFINERQDKSAAGTASYLTDVGLNHYAGTISTRIDEGNNPVLLQLSKKIVDKAYLTDHDVIIFGNSISMDPSWDYPEQNIYGATETMTAFCYDTNGNFIAATNTSYDSSIKMYEPVYNEGLEAYSFSGDGENGPQIKTFLLAGTDESETYPLALPVYPQRMTSNGQYIYFITTPYGERGDDTTKAYNKIYYFDASNGVTDDFVIPEILELTIDEFDIVTAVQVYAGKLFVAGEKKGSEAIVRTTVGTDDWNDYYENVPGYKSTYSVYNWLLTDAGNLVSDSRNCCILYSDDDMIESIKEIEDTYFVDTHLLPTVENTDSHHTKNTYVYGSISDLAVYEGNIAAIRNFVINTNSYLNEEGIGGTSTVKCSNFIAYGNIVLANTENPEQFASLTSLSKDYPYNRPNKAVPCRFIAIKPKNKELITSLLSIYPDSSSKYEAFLTTACGRNVGHAYLNAESETYQFEAQRLENDSVHLFDLLSYRNGSNFTIVNSGTLGNFFQNGIHLYNTYFNEND